MLAVHHGRMPKWLWNVRWNYDNVQITYIERMESMPLQDQMRLVSTASGLISQSGASFVNQLYLPDMSALLQVSVLWNENGVLSKCYSEPRTCHDKLGFSLGHSFLSWRWCYPSKAFSDALAVRMLKYLLYHHHNARRQRIAWACHILHLNPSVVPDEDLCSVETKAPWPAGGNGLRQCGKFGLVGETLLEPTLYQTSDSWVNDGFLRHGCFLDPKGALGDVGLMCPRHIDMTCLHV
eukprot:gnl/TRDRNA2_/TRDRNA2_136850_c0_seq3.p1 gnl/TRDRNA2_/TRDRNA2_136850_c0~~gnl/TRDRNA2_/TRDRNA2_136850_c0_seq3.p1  ORF type:complete len:237 (-),score=9.79 gnl/TRDRNA2_/TRDRNA2_136850_c0_seq3:12-722(-)